MLGVRPEHIRFSDDGAGLRGRVFGAEYLGTTQIVTVDTAHGQRQGAAAVEPAGADRRDGRPRASAPNALSLFDAQQRAGDPTARHEGAGHG